MSQLDEIKRLSKDLQRKNIKLDAMLWVWCSGGCNGGVFRYTPDEFTKELTLEVVETAECNVKRLRRWYENHEFKKQWKLMSDQERNEWFKTHEYSSWKSIKSDLKKGQIKMALYRMLSRLQSD